RRAGPAAVVPATGHAAAQERSLGDVRRPGAATAAEGPASLPGAEPPGPYCRRMSSRYADDLRLAHVLADAVDQLTMSRFKAQDLEVSTKPDLTEVTDADRAAEQLVRSQLSRSRSRDQVIGEEFGTTGASPRQWVIDPIDGTSNFVRGVPVWGTLIGLIEDGRPVVGLVSAPSLGRRWWGGEGVGAWTGSRINSASRLQVSS